MKAKDVEMRPGKMPSMIPVPDGKGSWLTLTGFHVISERLERVMYFPAGIHNDLASIPRAFRSVFSVNGPHRIAAIIHDAIYRNGGHVAGGENTLRWATVLTRKEADQLFYDLMRMSKRQLYASYNPYMQLVMEQQGLAAVFDSDKPLVGRFTAWAMYRAVRLGGWASWKKVSTPVEDVNNVEVDTTEEVVNEDAPTEKTDEAESSEITERADSIDTSSSVDSPSAATGRLRVHYRKSSG